MTLTRKGPLKVLPPLKGKKKSRSKSKSKSKSPPKNGAANGAANGHGAFNNHNMPPNNPRLSRGSRFMP